MDKEVIIIRHGRSQYNIDHTLRDADSPLTEYGRQTVENVGRYLADVLDRSHSWKFFTSPFDRCLQTASPIIREIREVHDPWIPRFAVIPELREYLNHYGEEATIPSRTGSADYNEEFFDWNRYQKAMTFAPEQNEEFLNRMHDAYDKLAPNSVVVTHGLPGMVLREIAKNPGLSSVPVWDHSLDNASITWIKRGRTIWSGRVIHHEIPHESRRKARVQ